MRPFPSGKPTRLVACLVVSLTGILLGGAFPLLPKSEAAAEDEGRGTAQALLRRCLSAQAALQRASFQVTAEIVVTFPSSDVTRIEYQTRVLREGDRMSITGTEASPDSKGKSSIRNFRQVVTDDLWVETGWPSTAPGPSQKTGGSFSKQQSLVRGQFASVECAGRLDTYFDFVRPIERAAEVLLKADGLRVRGEESIEGTVCKVIEGRTKSGTITLWLAESKGGLPLKGSHEIKPTDTIIRREEGKEVEKPLGEVVIRRSDAPGDGSLTFTGMTFVLDKVTVERIGEAFVTTAGRYTATEQLSDGTRWTRGETYRRSDIDLAPQFAEDAFLVNLPEESHMTNLDDGSGVEYVWRGGKVVYGHDDFSGTALGRWRTRLWLRWVILVGGVALLISAIWLYRRQQKGHATKP